MFGIAKIGKLGGPGFVPFWQSVGHCSLFSIWTSVQTMLLDWPMSYCNSENISRHSYTAPLWMHQPKDIKHDKQIFFSRTRTPRRARNLCAHVVPGSSRTVPPASTDRLQSWCAPCFTYKLGLCLGWYGLQYCCSSSNGGDTSQIAMSPIS